MKNKTYEERIWIERMIGEGGIGSELSKLIQDRDIKETRESNEPIPR